MTSDPIFRFRQGTAPLLVSMPHTGTRIPDALLRRMTPVAATLPDTDWHLEQLYDFLDYHSYEKKLDELFARSS